jgi:hypothetical protein
MLTDAKAISYEIANETIKDPGRINPFHGYSTFNYNNYDKLIKLAKKLSP